MSAWGGSNNNSASFRSSCDALLRRIENNDPTLEVLTILPTKQFGDAELDRLSAVLLKSCCRSNQHYYWHTLAASGHAVSCAALERFGNALATAAAAAPCCPLRSVALGDVTMGDEGGAAFCRGLRRLAFNKSNSNNNSNQHLEEAEGGASSGSNTFSSSSSLASLDLSYKGLSLDGFCSVAQLVSASSSGCCAQLQCLNLSRNSFRSSKREVADDDNNNKANIISFSGDDPLFAPVRELDLSSCEIDAPLASALFGKLFHQKARDEDDGDDDDDDMDREQNSNVPPRTLRLGNNPLRDAGFEALLVSGAASLLDGLHVSNCQLTDAALERWAVQEQSSSSSPSSSSDDGACCCCSRWPRVRTLDLSRNALTARGMAVWCCRSGSSDGLGNPRFLPALQEINLAGNPLGPDGVKALMEGLRQRFSCCSSSEESIPSLALLDLSETDCGPAGAVAAVRGSCCQHRAATTTTTSLRLYNNQLGSEGMDAVAQALADGCNLSTRTAFSSNLETLDLAGNGASQASIVNLLQVVLDLILDDAKNNNNNNNKDNFRLQCLVIGGNQGGEDVEEMVEKIHQIRPSMDIARDKLRKR